MSIPTFAALSLLLGALVYLTRPAGALFLAPDLLGVDLRGSVPPLFGPLGDSLPSFTHALAFTLLSAAALGVSRRTALLSAALWLGVETMFEVGQHPHVTAQLKSLGLGLGYFQRGTFDPLDLAACFFGVLVAFLLLLTHDTKPGNTKKVSDV